MKLRPETDPQEVLDALYRNSIAAFGERAFAVLEPMRRFERSLATEALPHFLSQIRNGRIKRGVVNMPPRTGKSTWASVIFAAFMHGVDPSMRIVCISYSAELAAKHMRDYRTLITSDWYKRLFPSTRIDPAKNSETEITLVGGGFRLASSVRGTLTGRGGDLIIIDDSMRADDALSDAKRKTPQDWFDGTLLSRLDDKAEGAILIVEQRLHEDDLTAHVLKKGGWDHLCLPAIAEIEEDIPIGPTRRLHRCVGDVLNPIREPLEVLEAIRRQMGELLFSAQYQQNPVPVEGNIVKFAWFNTYDVVPPPQRGDRIIQSWDPASSPGEKNDYSACITFALRGARFYVLDVLRVRLDYPELLKRVIRHRETMGADIVLMENSAHGRALIQDIRAKPQHRNLIPITAKDDKVTRMSACTAIIEGGDVYLPREASWLEDFRKELLQFPGGAHDDQVDAFSQALNWKRNALRRRAPIPVDGGQVFPSAPISYDPANYFEEPTPHLYSPKARSWEPD